MKFLLTAILSLLSFIAFSQPFLSNDRVDVFATDGKYYAATVLEVGSGQYKVRYIGYATDTDVWVKTESLVRGGAKGDKIVVTKASQVFYGTIEELAPNNYKVKYDGYPESYTLTRNQFSLSTSVEESRKNAARNPTTTTTTTTAIPNKKPQQTTTTMVNGRYPLGTKLLGLEGTTWYAATIIDYVNGKYKVKWDAYDTEAILTPDMVKPKPTLPADKLQPTTGKLYLRSLRDVISGYNELEWFFLGDNGLIIRNPMFGTNPVNPALEQVDNYNRIGTYTYGKTTLDANWLNGYKTSYPLVMRNGEISELDGGITVRQKGLPDNFKLDGTYDGSMSFGTIRGATTYTFKNDGSVTMNLISTAGVGGASQSSKEGNYSIKGNTLTINYNDGTKVISNIGMLDSKSLVVGSKYLKRIN